MVLPKKKKNLILPNSEKDIMKDKETKICLDVYRHSQFTVLEIPDGLVCHRKLMG